MSRRLTFTQAYLALIAAGAVVGAVIAAVTCLVEARGRRT
jgi:hypothetical protein